MARSIGSGTDAASGEHARSNVAFRPFSPFGVWSLTCGVEGALPPVNTSEPLPEEFSEPLARAASRTRPLASQVLWYPEVTSTNDVAARLAERGGEEGVLVLADGQTAGRGRRGREWASPPGAGVYA